MTLRSLIKYKRLYRKLTLRELSALSNVDHAFIHRIESGEKKPSKATQDKLLTALKLTLIEKELVRMIDSKNSFIDKHIENFVRNNNNSLILDWINLTKNITKG